MKTLIKKIDFLSPNLEVTYDGINRIRNLCGSFLSLVFIAIVGLLFLLFGIEMYYKNEPVSNYSKIRREESKVSLKEFPIVIDFVGNYQFINDEALTHLKVIVVLTTYSVDSTSSAINEILVLEACKAEFFADSQAFLEQIHLQSRLCVNPYIKISDKGVRREEEVIFSKEFLSNGSSFISIRIFEKTEYDKNLILGKYDDLKIIVNVSLKYIDLFDFANPIKQSFKGIQLNLSKLFYKSYVFEVEKDELETDDGWFFINNKIDYVTSYKRNTVEINGYRKETRHLATISFTSNTFIQKTSRSYLKLQTVIALVSSISKVVMIIFKEFLSTYATYWLYTDFKIVKAKKIKESSLNQKHNSSMDQLHKTAFEKEVVFPNFIEYLVCSKDRLSLKYRDLFELDDRLDLQKLFDRVETVSKLFDLMKREEVREEQEVIRIKGN